MTEPTRAANLLAQLDHLNEQQLRRLLVEHLTKQKLGLYWEANAIERDAALNADLVLPRLVEEWSCATGFPPPQPSDELTSHLTKLQKAQQVIGYPEGRGGLPASPTERMSQLVSPFEAATNQPPLPPGEGWGGGALYRNLIIEGDNYDSLRLLRATHAGKIRVIYIDPPYNTGNKDWVYNDHYVGANDRWRHSQWLEFLYRRLALARDLLTSDGVILVSINDENRARLELLMDEVFPGMRVGSLVWKKRKSSNTGLDFHYSSDHEHVLLYAREGFTFNGSEKTWDGYQNWDEEKQNWWSSGPLTLGFTKDQRPNLFYSLCNPETGIWYAVRLVRGEHQNYFHPDFVVCLSHVPGDAPVIRLIETKENTKENTKDAASKARRIPKCYGKVLFLTKDQSRLRVVNDDGSLGGTVDWDDLLPVQEWLRASKPTVQ